MMAAPALKKNALHRGKILPFAPMSSRLPDNERLSWLDWLTLCIALAGVAFALWGAIYFATG